MYKTIPRSSVIGFLIGVLPGAGATIASFLAYGMERNVCLLYTSPSPRDGLLSRMPSSA